MPKQKTLTKEEEWTQVQDWFKDTNTKLTKYKGYLESQLGKTKQLPNANAVWVVEFANHVYGDIILIFELLGEVADDLSKHDIRMAKLSGEMNKRREVLTRLKTALEHTDSILDGNR